MKEPVCGIVKPDGSVCGGSHYKTFCYWNRKTQPKARTSTIKPLSERFGKESAADRETKLDWIQKHGGIYARWQCYLRISPLCVGTLTNETLTMDHVIPKGRGKEYRHDLNNLRPACSPCNTLKGSSTLDFLAQKHPHLQVYLQG